MAAIVGVAAAILLVLVATGLLVSVPRPFANMFAYRRDAWPEGVQEDDEFHWRWSGRSGPRTDAPSDLAELSSVESESASPTRRRVTRSRTRSRV